MNFVAQITSYPHGIILQIHLNFTGKNMFLHIPADDIKKLCAVFYHTTGAKTFFLMQNVTR